MSSINTTLTTGIVLGAGTSYGSSLTVSSTGAIIAAAPGANAVYAATGGVYLLNQGIIAGGAGAYSASGTAAAGGAGVLFSNGGTVINAGSITGGAGGASAATGGTGGIGGIGVDLAGGGVLTNDLTTAVVRGGAGGAGAAGGTGGVGVLLGATAMLADGGRVYGGAGGRGTLTGGAGGTGVVVSAGAYVRNGYFVSGGNGGYGQTGGAGGTGIAVAAGGTVTNFSLVGGGRGGAGALANGAGGTGIVLGAGATLVNFAPIYGGNGGYGSAPGAAGGTGLVVGSGAVATNDGNIVGGLGGGAPYGTTLGGAGGAGVYVNGGTLIDAGTIAGGLGNAGSGARADAVVFGSAAGTLVVEQGAVFKGVVAANPGAADVLTVGGASGFALAGVGTEFTGFSTLRFGAGAAFTLEGNSAGLAAGQLIQGFAPGDTIDLDGVAATGLAYGAGGTLSLATTTGSLALLLDPANNFAGDYFALLPDGHGGTEVQVLAGHVASTLAVGNAAPINDNQSTHPFPGALVSDANGGPPTDQVVITLSGGDANGTLAGAGLTKTGTGTYTLAATSAAALSAELQALVFTPTQHEVAAGQTVTTNFTLTDTNSAGGTTTLITSLTVTALNYIYGPKTGFGLILGSAGTDVITAYGYGNAIYGNGGSDIINAGAGLAYVNVANGNASVALGGAFNLVQGGSGNVTVTGAPCGFTTVQLGNGNDTVSLGGTGDIVVLGNGNNVVSGTQGFAFIATGGGNDTITVGGIGNTINAGGGTNTITGGLGYDTVVLPGAGQGLDIINGFSLTNGDALNVDYALHAAGWNGNPATLGNYVKVTDSGSVATIAIAPGGSGPGIVVAELNNTGNITLANLLASHALR